ncbi:hypothetical protein ACOMHN_034002 [Nucella lapillus]
MSRDRKRKDVTYMRRGLFRATGMITPRGRDKAVIGLSEIKVPARRESSTCTSLKCGAVKESELKGRKTVVGSRQRQILGAGFKQD